MTDETVERLAELLPKVWPTIEEDADPEVFAQRLVAHGVGFVGTEGPEQQDAEPCRYCEQVNKRVTDARREALDEAAKKAMHVTGVAINSVSLKDWEAARHFEGLPTILDKRIRALRDADTEGEK